MKNKSGLLKNREPMAALARKWCETAPLMHPGHSFSSLCLLSCRFVKWGPSCTH